MDALLPPLDTFAVVELTAPPELNENSDSYTDQSSKEMESSAVEDTFLPANSEGDDEPADVNEDLQSPESESVVDSHIDECANDGSAVKGDLQLKQCLDDFFEARKDDSATEMVSRKFTDLIASPGLKDDSESAVRESLNGLLDSVILEIEGHTDANADHLTESDEDDEQPIIKECYVKLDKTEVTRHLRNQRRRLKRLEERQEAERFPVQTPLTSSTRKTSRSLNQRTLPNLTRIVCKVCLESFLEPRSFRSHFRYKHPDNLDEFISLCGQLKQYITCPLCQTKFRAKVDFNSHMTNLHSISRWVFESIDCYDEHLLGDVAAEFLRKKSEKLPPSVARAKPPESMESGQGFCDVCFKTFATLRGVAVHKAQTACGAISLTAPLPVLPTHKVRERPTSRSKVEPQTAPLIQRKPTPQVSMASTSSSNNQNRSFLCEWCRDRLKTTTQLNTHLRSKHSVPENFTPEGCDLPDFFTALEHHFTVVEKEENSYECVGCKETFLEKVGLLEHFSGEHLKSKVVGMQIKLQCGICSHEDSDVRNLHDHMWNAHANQRLEDMVIRVGDVSRSHRCGEECKLLWKKPVKSVEAAPRTEGRKRPSSEVKAMPRSAKQKKPDIPLGLQLSGDDDEMMRQIEEQEEMALREQEVSFGKNEPKRREIEDKKEKKRLYNQQYNVRVRAMKDAATEHLASRSILKSQLTSTVDGKLESDVQSKTTQCMLCLVQCADIKKHIQEQHSSSQGEGRSVRSRAKPQPPAAPVQVYAPPVPRPQKAKRSAPMAIAQVMRCSVCRNTFGDIVSLMNHQKLCSASTNVYPKKRPTPKVAPVALEAPATVKTAQFVLMDEDDYQPERNLYCKSCKIKYSTVGEWQAHIQEMHLNELVCELCNASFKDEAGLSKHIIKSHRINYPCLVCNTEYSNKKVFLSHMLQIHQINKQVFAGISLIDVERIKKIFEAKVFPAIRKRGNAASSQTSSSSSRKKSASARKPQLPNVKIEAIDLPVMYQCELCEVCYSTQEEIKQHMEYVH